MQLHPEDPRLTALLLGELSAEDAAAVERAIAADPALGMAFRELEHTQKLLTDGLAPASRTLHARQREAVLNAARHADQSGKITRLASARRSPKTLILPLAAAALVTLGVFLLVRLPGDSPPQTAKTPPVSADKLTLEVALLPAPGPAVPGADASRPAASSSIVQAAKIRDDALRNHSESFLRKVAEKLTATELPEAADLPPLHTRGRIEAASHPSLPLPVLAGRASLGWITHSIRQKRAIPPRNAVRLEEILNHFPLRPSGSAAVSQGVTLSTETIACPWKPSATLLLVSLRGAKQADREITASFNADPASVRHYRLLGFPPVDGLPGGTLPTRLPAASITSLVIEIEPSKPGADLGSITWSVDGKSAPKTNIAHSPSAEPSDDARFAALVCTYALWLTGDESGTLDGELLAALARECASTELPADRADFLNLIDQSLNR